MVIVLSWDVFLVKKTASHLGHRLFCILLSLIKYMITDHDSVTAVVTSEVCQISHIGYTGDGFFRCLDAACVDLAGFVYVFIKCL